MERSKQSGARGDIVDMRFQSAMAPADAELTAFALSCLLLRLQHQSDRVAHIEVEFVDAAGRVPRRDSYCIVSLQLHGLPAATLVDVGADTHLAIDRAAVRASRLAEQQLRQAGRPQAPWTEAVAA